MGFDSCPSCQAGGGPDTPPSTELPNPLTIVNIGSLGIKRDSFWIEAGVIPVATTYPQANLAIFSPFRVADTFASIQIACWNGATVSGNIDLGLYSGTGTKLASTGSIAHAGVSTLQVAALVQSLPLGRYYFAIACDNILATFFRSPIGDVGRSEMAGCLSMAAAFPLPNTATFAAPVSSMVPVEAITRQVTPAL